MPDFTSPILSILDYLSRPNSAVAGSVLAARKGLNPIDAFLANLKGDEKTTYGDVLRNEGMSPGPARALGFAGDVALDPLNFLPIGKVAKLTGLEAGAKLLGETKLAKGVGDVAGEIFNPFHNLPDDYTKARRLLNSGLVNDKAQAVENAVKIFKGTSPEERAVLSSAVEKPDALNAIADPLRKQQLTDVLGSYKEGVKGMADREIAAGVLKPEQVAKIGEDYGDYVPYRFPDTKKLQEVLKKPVRELSGNSTFAKERTLSSFEDAKALGAEQDLGRLYAQRGNEGARSIRINNFLSNILDNPEWAVKIPEGGLPAEYSAGGWRTISTNAANPVAEKIATYAVHPDIAPDVEKLFKNKQIPAFLRGFDKVTNLWKATATTMKPGFHLRNAMSNSFNMWLGGVSPASMPKRYAEAIGMMTGKIPAKIGEYAGPDLINKMKEYGVMGREFGFVGDLGDATTEALDAGLKPLSTKIKEGALTLGVKPALSAWNSAGKTIGANVEDASKVALFLDRVRKGDTAEDAALAVKKYLFDYQELSDPERNVLRRVVPFYTWLRKNVPLQLEHLYSDTGKFGHVAAAYNETEGLAKDEGVSVDPSNRPDFLKKLGAVQMPFLSKSGEKEFFNPNLPFQDLAKVFPTGENMQDNLAALHPVLKTIIERTMNESIFKDKPLHKTSNLEPVQAPMAAQLLAQTFPDLGKTLGIQLRKVKGKAVWTMPEVAAYAVDQLPVFNTLGKAAVNIGSPDTLDSGKQSAAPVPLPNSIDGAVPDSLMRPPALDFLLGMKMMPQSDQQLTLDKKFRRTAAKQQKLTNRRNTNNVMSDEDVQLLLGGRP
jgi:hypothetical protein